MVKRNKNVIYEFIEDDNHKECKKCLPSVGKKVKIDDGEGIVTRVNILEKKYIVFINGVGDIEKSCCDIDDKS